MKTILNTLLLSALVLCELPPPYPHRGFRPSPQFFDQFLSSQSPHTQYGPPRLQSSTLDVKIPSKLTIEQLIRLSEQLHSSQVRVVNKPQTIRLSAPQNSYLPPPRQPQRVYGPSSKNELSQSQLRPPPVSNFGVFQPQTIYGAPQVSQQTFAPSSQYGPPLQTSNTGTTSIHSSPQIIYGVPNVPQLPQGSQSSSFGAPNPQITPSTNYGVPNVPQLPQGSQFSSFGAPSHQIPPSTNYGVPDIRSIETFGELRNNPQSDQDILRQNLLNDFRKQHLPYKESTGFSPQGSQTTEAQNVPTVGQQYLPSNVGNNLPQSSQAGVNNPNIFQRPESVTEGLGHPSFTQGSTKPQNNPSVNQQYLPANTGIGGQYPQSGLESGQPGNTLPSSTVGGNIPFIGGSTNPSLQGGSSLGTTPAGSGFNNGGAVNNVGQNYLPPQTTPSTVLATRPTTIRPRTVQTTPVTADGTTNYDYDYDVQQPTEASTNQDDAASDPNVSISNAVAGGGGFFYLQQPDGRLQKVVLQKTQELNSKPEEYVANYYFQNIQALPSVTYTPLVSLGAWK